MSPRTGAARVPVARTATARTTADRAVAAQAAPKAAARKAAASKAAASKTTAPKAAAPKTTAPRAAAPKAAPAKAATTPPVSRPLRVVQSVPVRRIPARAAKAHGERRGPFVLLVVAMLVGTTLGLLVLSIAISVDTIDASKLRAQNAELAQDVQQLQREVVTGRAPAALAAAATAAGLVPAGSAAYLVIAPDGSSTLRGTVTPAPEPVKPSRVPADKD